MMTARQRIFLEALMADPQRNAKAAAMAAGCPEASAKVTASRWKKLPEVLAAFAASAESGEAIGQKLTNGEKLTTELTLLPEVKDNGHRRMVGICQLPGWEELQEKEAVVGGKGRPSAYTPALATEICELIANSDKSLARICRENDQLPAPSTVYYWLAQEQEFSDQYARAREAQADYLADQMIEIADDDSLDLVFDDSGKAHVNHEHINRSKVRIDTRKWKAAKLAPRKYGDKIEARIGGSETPIQLFMQAVSNTSTNLIGEKVPLEDEGEEA